MEFLSYLLKVSCCLTLFFTFYLLILRKLTFFKFNRFYLLAALVLSLVIPQLQFTIEREVVETATAIAPGVEINNEVVIEEIIPISSSKSLPATSFNWDKLWYYGYGLVAFAMLLIAMFRLSKLLIYTHGNRQKINGLNMIVKNDGFTNCSFFNYVFIAKDKLSETELKVLIQHEMVHAQQLHSVDKLMMIVAKALLWFNPIIYLYDKALEDLHEYEADEVSSTNVGVTLYANLLLKLAIAKSNQFPIHHFVKSPIKKRVKMLFNHKSKNMKKFVYLLAVPLIMCLLWSFTIDFKTIPSITNDDEVFTLVLDAGHGGSQKGITIDGFAEKDLTLAMAKKIKALAEAKGIKVITTRDGDKTIGLKDRVKAEGTILVSLHINSEPAKFGGKRNGIEIFTPTVDQGGSKLDKANAISGYLYQNLKQVKGINVSNRPKQMGMLLLNESKMPGIILELGYLTNASDFKFITNEQKQDELAESIVNGIIAYQKNALLDPTGSSNKVDQRGSLTKPKTAEKSSADFFQATNDTLRLVGGKILGKNPKVTIDGKAYDQSILTKISPKSVKATFIRPDSISILTNNNKVELATPIEISNYSVLSTVKSNQLYNRYTLKTNEGKPYEVLKFMLNNGSASFEVNYGWKVMLVINGKPYTEKAAKEIKDDEVKNYDSVWAMEKNEKVFTERYPQYIGKYDSVIEIRTAEKFVKHDSGFVH